MQYRPGTLRSLKLLLAAVVVLPILLFAGAGWLVYRWSFDEAEAELIRTTDAAHEHALKVFETNELVLDRIAERFGDMDWSQIAADKRVHDYLEHLAEDVPHVHVLGFITPDRRIVATNLDLPPAVAVQHNFMVMHRENDPDLLISEPNIGRYTGEQQFIETIVKPHTVAPPGAGVIFVSIRPGYFRKYYDDAFGHDYAISIIRADGVILARNPDLGEGMTLSPESGFRRHTAEQPEHGIYSAVSAVDGRKRLFSYRKVDPYPIYVAVGIDYSTIVAHWWQKMASHLVFGVPATLCLIVLAAVALRRTARERTALLQAAQEARRREELEASLYQAQKMEAVGQLTGGVAHDFNNLLTAVMGGLEAILGADDLSEPLHKHAGAAMRAAERGARLTQQLLAFSRQQMLSPEIVDANRLLREFETLMQRAVGESIEFRFALDPAVAACRVDPAQFQSAVLNLVVNARDATPPGGIITVETRTVDLPLGEALPDPELAPGRYVRVSVSDTGSGMTPEVRAQAFNPFFTTKEIGKGSGLGLSQVYGFTKQSGGHVNVESEPGHGTTVRLFLPCADLPAEPDAPAPTYPTEPPARAATVLIVEDDDAVRETAEEALADLGYRTLAASDATGALGILRRGERVDILFSDIVMPGGVNGVELAREARRLRGELKVLLTSGYAEDDRADGFATLSKPYRQSQLAEKIATILAEAR